jgi:hypothetical protein
MADCSNFILPSDWPVNLGIDPYAGQGDTCPPFVFPQPELDEDVDAYIRRVNFWIATVYNHDKQQIVLGRGNAPVRKHRRITPSQKNR